METSALPQDTFQERRHRELSQEYSEETLRLIAELLPNVSVQMRSALVNTFAALNRIAPIEDRKADPALDQNTAILLQGLYRLQRFAGNLGDISGLLAGHALPLKYCDLASLAEKVYREALPLAECSRQTLRFCCEKDRLFTAANSDAVRRILFNLLSNAMKFTPAGGEITIRCRRTDEQILLCVEDTGCGISPELSEQLFDRYLYTERMDPAPHGLGLGLPLSRYLAEAQGGRLLIESRVEGGTCVTLALPFRIVRGTLETPVFDYTGGFSQALVELSDALSYRAFLEEETHA